MKRILMLTAALLLLVACQTKHDDEFEFEGKVIDYEICSGYSDVGYAVQLSRPDSVGGNYYASDSVTHPNVVVVYRADRLLRHGQEIKGKIYFNPNYSDAECNYHYRQTTGDVPEACFSKLEVVK